MVFMEREARPDKPGGKGRFRKTVCIANEATGVYEPVLLPEHAANKMLTSGRALEAIDGECPYEPAEIISD